MIERLQSTVNATEFRGYPPKTLLLNRWKWHGKKLWIVFQHRPHGYGLHCGDQVFEIYRGMDMKYALRALHRAGWRDVTLSVRTPRQRVLEFSVDSGDGG